MTLSRSWRFFLSQALWMLQSFFSLVFAMGGGLKWMVRSVRVLLFGILIFPAYSYHIFWYIVSPTVIRRVAYRASRVTKMRNLRMLLQEERAVEELLESTARRTPLAAVTSSARQSPSKKSGCDLRQTSLHNLDEISSLVCTQVNDADGSLLNAPVVPTPPATPLRRGHHIRFTDGLEESIDRDLKMGPCSWGDEGAAGVRSQVCHSPLNDTIDCVEELLGMHPSAHHHRPPSLLGSPAPHAACGSAVKSFGAQPKDNDEEGASKKKEAKGGLDAGESSTSSNSDDEEDPEDAVNLHNRAYLDVFLPVPLDSLMKTFHDGRAFRGGGEGGARRRKRFPIVVIVGGGAWIIGCNLWAALLARLFAAVGYLAFTPDYRNFPQATMEEMVLDVSDSIAWVVKNAERYNGDVSDITIVGQSAGAHLTMMSLLSQARVCSLRRARQQAPDGTCGGPSAVEASASLTVNDISVHMDELDSLGKASRAVYNRPRYNPREAIRRYVGLSGIYNVKGLAPYLHRRGLYKHVMYRLTGGKQHAAQYSIPFYFDSDRCGETGDPLPLDVFDFLPKSMDFLHGDQDQSAPLSESTELVSALRKFQAHAEELRGVGKEASGGDGVSIRMLVIPNASHTDPFVDEPLCGRACVIEHCQRQPAAPTEVEQLKLTVTSERRPFLLTLARHVCPF